MYHHIPSEPTAALPWDFQAEHTNSIEREILSYSETRTFETTNELHDWVKAIAEKASNYEYTTITPVTDEYGSVIAYTQTVNWTEVVREKVYFTYGFEEPFAVKDAIWLSMFTNVSHDIKTPLTSIINYVDLLGKEEIESETVKEYIEVLTRLSARLMKLIEDLVEASKASTGNLAVNQEVFDLNLLVSQTTAEFEDKFAAKEIETVTTLTQAPAMVRADGRLMWRVFENLMSNVCKYAQAHTRLYVSTETVGDRVRVTMKNTSQYALNITGEELIERFIRGDASRHTEGSGLGLSIASSLVELQGGSFAITIDGDLFKVMVDLPRA